MLLSLSRRTGLVLSWASVTGFHLSAGSDHPSSSSYCRLNGVLYGAACNGSCLWLKLSLLSAAWEAVLTASGPADKKNELQAGDGT